ncbi:MAG: oppA, partial [Haloplasmataceae bacterium]|nr:oppA [Haloplasmataceae bacterium]
MEEIGGNMRKIYWSLLILFTTSLFLSGCRTTQPLNNPVIVVNEDFVTQYEVGSQEPNWLQAVIVNDTEDGAITLTESDVDQSKVNMNVVGEFDVTYNIKDSDNNLITKVLTIKIVDTTEPVINGLIDLTFVKGSAEPNWLTGITATDNYEGAMTLSMDNVNKSN